jgi:hypothetical protein
MPGSPFTAGGAGTGAGLASQGAVQLAGGGRFLLAADAGSSQVSVLRVGPGGALLLSKWSVQSTNFGSSLDRMLHYEYREGMTRTAAVAGSGATGTRLTPKGRATRARIVAAASELMLAQGAARTTVEDIRAAAGVSASQMYHYFADKEALVMAVIGHQEEQVLSVQREGYGRADSLAALAGGSRGVRRRAAGHGPLAGRADGAGVPGAGRVAGRLRAVAGRRRRPSGPGQPGVRGGGAGRRHAC